jgi:hypothetical protein
MNREIQIKTSGWLTGNQGTSMCMHNRNGGNGQKGTKRDR